MSEHPSEWTMTTFGNVLKQRKEVGHPDEELLAVTSSMGIVKRESLERRDTSNEDKSKYLLIERGDIAYNTMRMWQGVSGVSRYRGIASPAYTICVPTDELDADFAGYLLKDPELISIFRQRSQGLVSDTWNLKYEEFAQIPCALPPLPEQKKIAEILSGIDEWIITAENQAQYHTLLLNSILQVSFSHEAGETVTLGEIAEFKSGRAFKSEELSEDGMKVTRISNLHKPSFPYWKYKGEYNSSIIARNGDILFSWAGVANSINVHRYKGEDTLLNQHIYNFEFRDPLLKEWTYWSLKNMLPRLRVSIEGGAGQLHLTKGFIQSLPIPIIARSKMESLCQCFQSLEKLGNKQKALSSRLSSLKNALSSDLLSGRKRVTI